MPAMTLDRSLPRFSLPAMNLHWPRWMPLALLALVLLLFLRLLPGNEPPVSRLQIDGRFEHVTPESVRLAAMPRLEQGFFSLDIDAVHDDIAALPWVAKARVERVWPVGVRVRIWERQAAARWNNDALLDTGATIFRPAAGDLSDGTLSQLPQLGGSAGNEALVARTWNELSRALQETPLALQALHLDARGEWTAQTRRGVELRLGPGDATAKLEVLRTALPAALGERLSEVAYVDLRYTNGFAIGWLVQEKPAAASAATIKPQGTSPALPASPVAAPAAGQQRGIKNG